MSQPWRRGSGRSKWSTPTTHASINTNDVSNETPPRQPQTYAPQQRDSIQVTGMRVANLRPVRANDFDLSSPSRGENVPGRSLTDHKVQEEYREHLETRIDAYKSAFPDELGIIIHENIKQKEHLDLILLDLRKLREGIISGSRKDAFAIEVYETSAKLAILADNRPQLATILPHLVNVLHRLPANNNEEDALVTGLKSLSLNHNNSVDDDIQARFLAYYLLHCVCHSSNYIAYQQLLRRHAFTISDHSLPVLQFAQSIVSAYRHNNYAFIARVIANPYQYDKFAWLILRSDLKRRQDVAMRVISKAYKVFDGTQWLCRVLAAKDEVDLKRIKERAIT